MNDEKVDKKVDKWGFTIKPTITDPELILMCLRNAPCGADKKQVERLTSNWCKNFGSLYVECVLYIS